MSGALGWRRMAVAAALLALAGWGCAPRLRPLPGTVVPVALPRSDFPPGHRRLVFNWELVDPDLTTRGEGAARVAPPDSVRLDFFVGGGVASGAAVLIGDDLRIPPRGDELARRLIPPPPLLWAALGRLAVPALADTVARVDGDTLRADIGSPTAWRATFVRGGLRKLERVDGGRVVEWVERHPDATGAETERVRYRQTVNRRQLDLFITRRDDLDPFDSSTWVFR